MSQKCLTVLLALAVLLAAGALRFCRLGAWPFANDELATIHEADVLVAGGGPSDSAQTIRLPRVTPLAYGLHYLGHRAFGKDEFGSRVLAAAFGTAAVVALFLGLAPLLGRAAALAAALLAATCPEHLFQSQQDRFYVFACFFSTLCLLCGAHALRRRSAGLAALACLAALAAVLCHTLQGVLFGGLFAALLAAAVLSRQRPSGRVLATVTAGAAVAALLLVFYLLPLLRGWNRAEGWGYSPARSLLASVHAVGWPVALLAAVGAVLLVKQDRAAGAYWGTWAALWAAFSLLLPAVVVYHPSYAFPLALPAFVLAGYGVAAVAADLRRRSAPAALLWAAAAVALVAPGLLSYYRDGSRHDYRTAARYVARHYRPGDRLVAVTPGLVAHYAPDCPRPAPLTPWDPLRDLAGLEAGRGRTWVVVPSNRSGKPEALRRWLARHCTQELEVRAPRLDYYEFVVEVFLYSPRPQPPESGTGATALSRANR